MKNNLIGISGKIGAGKDEIGKIIQYLSFMEEKNYNNYSYQDFIKDNKENAFDCTSNYKVKKFADKLKDIVCLLIGCTREQLEDREFKEKELGEEWWYYKGKTSLFPYNTQFEANKKLFLVKLTPRKLLQLLGTECGRQIIHPNIWVNALMNEYKPFIKDYPQLTNSAGKELIEGENYRMGKAILPNWIITDVRFPNEVKDIKDRDGIVIRINRLKVEDIVYWDDPEMGLSSGVYKIRTINNEEAWIEQMDSMSEAQVPLHEISLFKESQHFSETALDDYKDFDYTIDNNGTIEELIEKIKKIL